ncbi:hypothetical protein GIB67_035777 [Kingdonia uniflora]|uniref:Hexosyltransferase n=1 Tax=Kingdonia uniflora TaxID=39325 RepID=A0A7J7MJR7_9MAGN|nr:hypothetical protein GIB67_035777 [Kingdonia uniflora]
MASWRSAISLPLLGLLSFVLFHPISTPTGIRLTVIRKPALDFPVFREAPAFGNGESCGSADTHRIHIVMTFDANYLRGTMATILSILQHFTCPENVEFHFYLQDIIPVDVGRIIYLDSDIVVVDDIAKLWGAELDGNVVAAPEYCHANFTKYFTGAFWSDSALASTFDGRKPCYFNTGVMVIDVDKWRKGGYTQKVEGWMVVQKHKRIYHLGSLPPFLLVMAGNIKADDHRWNQHGLGGDNLEGKCRSLHPGPISLLHWIQENRYYCIISFFSISQFVLNFTPAARFSLDDKYSRQRFLLKKRFGLLPIQSPPPKY